MRTLLALADRTLVLFLGMIAGALIALSFRPDAPAPVPPPILVPPQAATDGGGGRPATVGTAPPPVAVAGRAPQPGAPPPPPPVRYPVAAGEQLAQTVAAGRPVRVAVFGDSFGDGVWWGLNQQLPRKAGFEVLKYSQQATGFTRYKSLNLERRAAELLGADPVDVVVISYGANDTQGVITGAGKYAALLSPAWQEEIGARVESFVRLMRAHGAMVYWVGLPRMRKAAFDADIMGMNAFYEARMRALGVPFVETVSMSSGPDGAYAAYLIDEAGKRRLIRADDGIHMSMPGYARITRDLAGQIQASVEEARRLAGVPGPAEAQQLRSTGPA